MIGVDKNIKKDVSSNKSDISTNSGRIITNKSAISTNLEQISTNTSSISSNSNLINSNTSSISTNLEKIDNFTQYILQSGKDFEEKYTIEKQIFKFNKDKHFYTMFEKEIEYTFTKNSLLFVKNHMYYKYENLSNDYYRLQHEYNIYDDENNLIHKYLFNKDTYYDESLDPILHTDEDFCICFKKNYNKIKINLQLHRHNRHGVGNINLEIDNDNENYINIDYLDRNSDEQVDTNARDISTNLSKININVADISSNLGKINNNTNAIKLINKNSQDNSRDISTNLEKINNITKTIILKNIYFTNFDSTDESFTRHLISLNNRYGTPRTNENAVIHSVNMEYYFKKDDFIEIDCKLMFQHTTYDYSNDTFIYYNLYKEVDGKKQILFRESRRYNQFSLVNAHNRVIAYNKLCYKVKYDIDNIIFTVIISAINSIMNVDYSHYIVKNGLNHVSIKHYGKS